MTTRRKFLAGATAAAAAVHPAARAFAQNAATGTLTLTVDAKKTGVTVPVDFTGLSYESAQLGHPDFFSADNKALIAIFRQLGEHGVLRIGGNTGEYTTWSADDADAEKNHTPLAMGPDAGTAAKTASIITPRAIRNLKDFVDACGWHVIYGLNLWHGTPENAAAEAKYVAATLGDKLICFQIGNEPDMDHDPGSKERWTFEHYYPLWEKHRDAVLAAVPNAKFAGPDIAKEYDWLPKMAARKPELVFLSGHYYAEGPPANPKMTLEFLLKRGQDPASGEIEIVHEATKMLGRPFRMTEGNSCFHGGKPLVSDTLASALWGGDYWLQIAQAGYIGVNFHGGGNGLYTPIAGSLQDGFKARPVCYGMLMGQKFAGSTFVGTVLSQQTADQNVTAFAARKGAKQQLAVFNKAAEPVTLKVNGLGHAKDAKVWWLKGPAIDAHDGVTFGGSELNGRDEYRPAPQDILHLRGGNGELALSAYTAAYIEA